MLESVAQAIGKLEQGAYAVGVSGGADSIALLHALHHSRQDLKLHVVHLNHEARGEESEEDARFVARLAAEWGLNVTIRRIRDLVPDPRWPTNVSARYRAARHAIFHEAVERHRLMGVVLAHHADDQAETLMLRLLRGTTGIHVSAMHSRATVGGLRLFRPLLQVRQSDLRDYLRCFGQDWREDASNQSDDYQRNCVRKALRGRDQLTAALIALHEATSNVRRWVHSLDGLPEEILTSHLAAMGSVVGEELSRRWLAARGVPRDKITTGVAARLVEMASDAATPPRQEFPGGIVVRRRAGRLFVDHG